MKRNIQYVVGGLIALAGIGMTLLSNTNIEVLQGLRSAIITYPRPSLTLYVTPSSIESGQRTTAVWQSTNTTYCSSNFGVTAPSGRKIIGPLSKSSGLILTCRGKNGSTITRYAVINVKALPTTPKPTISTSFYPSTITSTESSTLMITGSLAVSDNRYDCGISYRAPSENMFTHLGSPQNITSFYGEKYPNGVVVKVTCYDPTYGAISSNETKLTVNQVNIVKPTVTAWFEPATISSTGSSTLKWTAVNANDCGVSYYANNTWINKYDSYVFTGSKFPNGTTAKVTCYSGNTIVTSEAILTVNVVKPSVTAWFEPATITSTGASTLMITGSLVTSDNRYDCGISYRAPSENNFTHLSQSGSTFYGESYPNGVVVKVTCYDPTYGAISSEEAKLTVTQ